MMIQPILASTTSVTAKAGNEAAQVYGLSEALPYLSGFMFVVGTLILLWFLTFLMGAVFVSIDKKKKAQKQEEEQKRQAVAAAAAVAAVNNPAQTQQSRIDPCTVAVITAAAQTALTDQQFQILSIKSASSQGWSAEGRRAIFDGRKVR